MESKILFPYKLNLFRFILSFVCFLLFFLQKYFSLLFELILKDKYEKFFHSFRREKDTGNRQLSRRNECFSKFHHHLITQASRNIADLYYSALIIRFDHWHKFLKRNLRKHQDSLATMNLNYASEELITRFLLSFFQ